MGTDESPESSSEPSVFETTATYEQTKLEVYQEQLDRWIVAPMKILWSDYRGRFGLIVVTFYVLMGTVGTMIIEPPSPNMTNQMIPAFSDPAHPLGSDGLGQDMLSLMVWATPDMLKMILAGAIFGNLLGVSIGLFSGYVSGTTDKVIMTITDTIMSIPGIPLLIILAAILEPTNPFLIGIILNIQGWAGQARILRSQVFPLVHTEHVEAARAMGQPMSAILVKEILPHLLPYIFIGFLGGATTIVFASVALYFLGILPFDNENWGVTLNYAYETGALYSTAAAHWLMVPLVTIVGLTVGLTLLAQAFDQVFNPRVRARHQARKQGDGKEREQDPDLDTAVDQMDTM